MVDQLQEWQSDPAGKHRFRLHADGRPTDWVSDGTTVIHDPLPAAQEYPGVAGPGPQAPPAPEPLPAQSSAPGGLVEASPISEPVRPAGWYRSAANPTEVRYWDGWDWTAAPDESAVGPPATNGRGDHGSPEPHVDSGDGRGDLGAAARPSTAGAPANWYPDPADRTRLRYWDGLGWTEQVIDEAPAPRL
jgi:Protein of unknown function (DUF2510)